jgi:hypothetical protein
MNETILSHINKMTYNFISIRDIQNKKILFQRSLSYIYNKKRKDYLDTLIEYNPDRDCVICYETPIELCNGDNCTHQTCRNCYHILVDSTNKCPTCREILDNTKNINNNPIEQEEEEEDEDFEILHGNNDEPTTDLFNGRRWLNTQTNTIEYYEESNIGVVRTTNVVRDFQNYIVRSSEITDYYIDGCCASCGIQRTEEVNEYMKTHNENYIDDHFGGGNIGRWSNFFVRDNIECFDCFSTYIDMMRSYESSDTRF